MSVGLLLALAGLGTRLAFGRYYWEVINRDAIRDATALPPGELIARRKVKGVWQYREATKADIEDDAAMWAIR